MHTIALLATLCSASGGSLLENGDFEAPSGPDKRAPIHGWTANAELARQQLWLDSTDPQEGRQCLALRALEQTEAPGVLSQDVPVQPDTTYSLTLWAKRDSFVYGTVFEVLLRKDGEQVGRQSKNFRSTTWRPLTMVFDSGDATLASVRIVNPNKGTWRITVGRTLWVDDVNLVAVDHAEDICLNGNSERRLSTEVDVQSTGHYFLWVRTLCPGRLGGVGNRFRLRIDGNAVEFQSYTAGDWYWLRPILPEFIISRGRRSLELDADVDGILIGEVRLTMDPFWQPPDARAFLPADTPTLTARREAEAPPDANGTLVLTCTGDLPDGRWGVTQGVPFPEGVLRDAAHIALPDRPLQSEALAHWPDGSIKWLLVSTQAAANEQLVATYGPASRASATTASGIDVREDQQQVAIDTGRLSFVVPKDGSALLQQLRSGDRVVQRISGIVNGTFSSSGSIPTVAVEERGPVRAVVRIAGTHRDDSGAKLLDYVLRVYAYAGADTIELEHSFLLTDDLVETALESVVLRLDTPSTHVSFSPGDEAVHSELDERPVTLRARSASDSAKVSNYPYVISRGDTVLAEGVEARGRFAVRGPGPLRIAIRDFWQNAPKTIRVTREAVDIGLVGESMSFYKGMAKTHHLVLSFASDTRPLELFEARPLLLTPPEWTCESRALHAWPLPRAEGSWPGYEHGVEVTINDWKGRIEHVMRRPQVSGMLHYGDSTYGKGGNNLETALGEGCMIQFLRTGRRDYFELADRMIRHFVDIDIDHSTSSAGLIWPHGPHARTEIDPGQKGVNGHSWYNGTVYYAFFTGSRRVLETARQVGQYYTRWPFPLQPYIHYWRAIAWKFMDLMQAYDVTGDRQFLAAALRDVEVTRYQRDHLVTLWPYMYAVGMKALRHYYEATADPEARELYLQLMDGFMRLRERPDDTVNGEWPKAEGMLLGNFPNDRSCAFYNEAAHATWLSGDERFGRAAAADLNWQIAFGVSDPTLLWGSADLLRLMTDLDLHEPRVTATLPRVFMTPAPEGSSVPVCSRPLILGQIREERDQPFSIMLFKASYRKYTHDYQGDATLFSPDGARMAQQQVRTSGLRRYQFDVPKDGKTGLYTVAIRINDPWRWTLDQIDFSLSAGQHVLKVWPRYNREVMDCFCLARAGTYFPTVAGEPPADAMIVQAEEGVLPDNFAIVAMEGAHGGRAVRMLRNSEGSCVEHVFTVPNAGVYRFFARVWKGHADLLNVTIDDQPVALCKQTHDMDGNAYPVWSLGTTLGGDAVVPSWQLLKRNFASYDPSNLVISPALSDALSKL